MKKGTEQIILEVARKQFVQRGFAATRMQEIADEAGINKAMLHYYFRSKEKLYKEIITDTLNTIVPKFAGALSHPGTFWEQVEKIVETYIDTLIEIPEVPFFIMSELSQKKESFIEEIKKQSQYFPVVQSFIVKMMQEMQAGNIKQLNPLHLFLNIMGMCIFPFMVRPIFSTVFDYNDENYEKLMLERKTIIVNFLKDALIETP